MNIELEEVAVQDVSDDALEMAAGGAQGDTYWRWLTPTNAACPHLYT